jgi:alkanesulfonate monooxygenase SsuD/methylene tetrahydromethanopterin reductase-like flavin-dependent oxidoreductase (luciferase family)
MRVGTVLPQRSVDRTALDVARESEDLGYDSVFVFDHLIPLGAPPGTPILDGFTTLAAAAAVTSRVGLVTLVARAAMRPPVMTVHLARTLGALGGGRAVLGLGAGDSSSAREDEALGVAPTSAATRRERLRETIAAVRGGVPDLPVWVGGTSEGVRRIAAEEADGWNGWAVTPDEVRDAAMPTAPYAVTWGGQVLLAPTAAEAAERAAAWNPGRGPAEKTRLVSGDARGVATALGAFGDAGVIECLVAFVGGEAAEQRRAFARDVLPLLR